MKIWAQIAVLFLSVAGFAQNTLVRSADVSTNGPISLLGRGATSLGLIQILNGANQNGVGSVSVIRNAPNGAVIPIESTTELFPGESVGGRAGFVDSIGKYFYAFRYVAGNVAKIGVRGSSEALGGVAGGWTTDLGAYSGTRPSMADDPNNSSVIVLLPSTTGYRIVSLNKSTGSIKFDRTILDTNFASGYAVGNLERAIVRSGGGNFVYFSAWLGNFDSILVCLDKSGTEVWRKTVHYQSTLPNGVDVFTQLFDYTVSKDNVMTFTYIYEGPDVDDVRKLRVERLDPSTGVTISQSELNVDVLGIASPRIKTLSNGDVAFIFQMNSGSNPFLASYLNRYLFARVDENGNSLMLSTITLPGESLIMSSSTTVDADIDEAGNFCVSLNASSDLTQGSKTQVCYVDNTGLHRWTQNVSSSIEPYNHARALAMDPFGRIYSSYQYSPVAHLPASFAGSQLRLRQYQPALFMPITSDARGAITSHLYWSANEQSIRLVRSGTANTLASYTPGDAFRPMSLYTQSSGNVSVLLAGTAAGSGRLVTFAATSAIPSSITDFVLPSGSGTVRDVAVDSSGRTWVTSNVKIGNTYNVKYHRLNLSGTAVEITRTLFISGYPSSALTFDPVATSFRFGCNLDITSPVGAVLTGSSGGALSAELDVPISNSGVYDIRNTTTGKSFVLLSDQQGVNPGRLWRTNTAGTALEQDFALPWSPGLIPVGVGAIDTNNARVIWHEIGGKIQFRNMTSGSPGAATVLDAVMN